ncbi:MAG: NACHT domain-containing protein [Phycisphaerae bacterium]|nr:NACHT domain-containing protein [Phycisphaerae bacterium]
MALAEATTIAAGKVLFKKVVGEVYAAISKNAGTKIKQWNTDSKIDKLYSNIAKIRKVKTIWQLDKAVDLNEFYCDSHVEIGQKRTKVHSLADLGPKENFLIQGIAGQGKSILLRYLCCNELALGQYIPLFLELRRIGESHNLRERIFAALKTLKLDLDDALFDILANSGRLLLLLDAFDEVPDKLKNSVLTDIEDLAQDHERLRIIVTSRPNNHIEMSSHFTVVRLSNLKGSEYKTVIHKLSEGEKWADTLIKHIESRARHLKELLCTPLMVTLLNSSSR